MCRALTYLHARFWFAALGIALGACGDSSTSSATGDVAVDTIRDDADADRVVVDETAPVITLLTPDRGSSSETLGQLVVSGSVEDDGGEVASLTINGAPVTLPTAGGGAFSASVDLAYGLTLIDVVATDPHGNTRRTTRAVEASDGFVPMNDRTMASDGADDAVVMTLSPEAVDDGDHDEAEIDDLASVFKTVLDGLELGSLMPDPLFSVPCGAGECQVTFANFTASDTDVDLTLKPGRLGVTITLMMPAATVNLVVPCDACASTPVALPGTFSGASVTITTEVAIGVVDGRPDVSAQDTVVVISGLSFDISDTTGQLQAVLATAITAMQDDLAAVFESFFTVLVENQVAGVLGGLVDGLALDQVFELQALVAGGAPNRIVINTVLAGVDVDPTRFQLRLDGLAYAESPMRPFPVPGSIDHVGCAPASGLSSPAPAPVVIGLHDTFINQMAFAAWEGATLSLELGPAATAPLVDGLGVTNMTLKLEGYLPPLFNSCTQTGERAQVGDLFLDATFELGGQQASVALWLSTEAAIDVSVVDDAQGNAAVLALGELDPLLVEVVRNEGFFEDDEQALITLLRTQLLPLLLDTLSGAARFELPKIDLSQLADGLPRGTLVNIAVDAIGRDGGYLTAHSRLH
ncbi:MAG: hypothetical protein ACI9MR_001700 [Myxococcota bacterium]|jgi:hypothetical protein